MKYDQTQSNEKAPLAAQNTNITFLLETIFISIYCFSPLNSDMISDWIVV